MDADDAGQTRAEIGAENWDQMPAKGWKLEKKLRQVGSIDKTQIMAPKDIPPEAIQKEDGCNLCKASVCNKAFICFRMPGARVCIRCIQNKLKCSFNVPEGEDGDGDDENDEEDEEYRWWDDPTKGDGTKKWTTLEHNGVVFPPPYELLPKNVKMKYNGTPIQLHPDAEEVASFFGTMLNSEHNVGNPVFQKNFFMDFKDILKKTGGAKDAQGNKVEIKEFDKCDFKPMFEYLQAQRDEKKALPPAEKKRLKAEKDEVEAPYQFCTWDGRKQKVGNFRVEPPSLFRGRGEHPKTGRVKTRVQPEQITINIGKEATVPPPPAGHKWKEVKHDQEGTWLAMWQENINGNYKYVMLAANEAKCVQAHDSAIGTYQQALYRLHSSTT